MYKTLACDFRAKTCWLSTLYTPIMSIQGEYRLTIRAGIQPHRDVKQTGFASRSGEWFRIWLIFNHIYKYTWDDRPIHFPGVETSNQRLPETFPNPNYRQIYQKNRSETTPTPTLLIWISYISHNFHMFLGASESTKDSADSSSLHGAGPHGPIGCVHGPGPQRMHSRSLRATVLSLGRKITGGWSDGPLRVEGEVCKISEVEWERKIWGENMQPAHCLEWNKAQVAREDFVFMTHHNHSSKI